MTKKSDKRKNREQDHSSDFPSPPPSRSVSPTAIPQTLSHPEFPIGPPRIPLLICSLGNPNPTYTNTLHSAGHTVLMNLHSLLSRTNVDFTAFTRERSMGNGLVSRPVRGRRLSWFGVAEGASIEEDWTLWQSMSLMNVSGKGVADAFKKWKCELRESNIDANALQRATLVILHDELEKAVGKIVIRKEKSSMKGHNGLKSVQQALGGQNFIRIGIGIGRPKSRDQEMVSRHVLRKMTPQELDGVEGTAHEVLEALREIAEGK
jgi:PTH1 family peptidyl-tRNA hydrolase